MPHEEVSRLNRGAAKRLRSNMTDAEHRLWHLLRAHRFGGVGFRRQAPMGRYVVDFVSHRLQLVIEVDGGQHARSSVKAHDRVRDQWLGARGYRVLRFTNVDVLRNLEGVADRIANEIPPSQPSPARGEGLRVSTRSIGAEGRIGKGVGR
jgi:very-short-patch-repair endonuclease